MQDGLKNLRDLLKGDLSDIVRFINRPPSGLVDFKRIAAQFGVGGTIIGLAGVSLNYIIHYGDNNNGTNGNNGNDGNNNNGGQQTTATATATSSTSTPEPTEWLLNTVPGTSREAFEDFVNKLPDHGSGERIIFPNLPWQNYVTKMTLEQAKEASKVPIVDQISANDPIEDPDKDGPQNRRSRLSPRHQLPRHQYDQHQKDRHALPHGHQRHRRLDIDSDVHVLVQTPSRTHLGMISAAKDQLIRELEPMPDKSETKQYYYEKSAGAGSFIYVLDSGFDFTHLVSFLFSNQRTLWFYACIP